MGGGLLTSIPFITTSCGDKLANQTISGNQTLSGGQRIAGSQEYNTTATTVATWTIAATDGSQLPNGIKMESNKLTWDDTLSYGQYSITIKCKASNYNDATYPVTLTIEKTIEINNTNVASYLTDANSSIFYNGSSSYTVGNQLLNLKEFSAANGNITHYVVTENISFGFLVDPDMDCHISAKDGVTITCNGGSNETDGVIVGTTSSDCSGIYTKNLIIDPNATFIISSSGYAYGVYFNNAASGSTQTINGTFTIESVNSYAYGVIFISTASGTTTINGTFTIESVNSYAYGVFFWTTTSGSNQIINGTFTISAGNIACGVRFYSTASGTTTINGTFTISAENYAYGVNFYSTDANSTQTINGTFTIFAGADAYGVYFAIAASGNLTINGIFTILGSDTYGFYFYSDALGNLTINGDINAFASVHACGIYFKSTVSGDTTINGIFNISSSAREQSASGIDCSSAVSGNFIVNGTFTISEFSTDDTNVFAFYFSGGGFSGNISFGENNLFILKAPSCYSCFGADFGSRTNKMNVFGTAGNDSGTNASAYATYSNDSSINITITTSNSNPNFQVGYYASINPNDDTKSLVKEALEYYIEQPYCPVVGKIWIISVLEQMK